MQCLWLENRQLSIREVQVPHPAAADALVRVHLAGVCGTDLALLNGYRPYSGIPGHEFVGEVMSAPTDTQWEGRRVVGEINVPCHDCPTCAAGRTSHCPHRSVLGIVDHPGVFAELITLPVANLHQVPEGVSDDQAVFTEPLAAALRITEQVTLAPSDRVLLIGAGRLGQLIAQVLVHAGCQVHALAKHPVQRNALRERRVKLLNPDDLPPAMAPFDIVVEATGSSGGFAQARQAVRPGGTLVLNSTFAGTAQVDLSSLVVDEITVIGSRCGPFDKALALLAEGKVDPLPMIEATYPLQNAVLAFEHARRPAAFKILIRPPA
jgi:2-desacetyl-2-hydroxyethyl bacteriochlorophyllide A dehydrogenase